MKNIAKSVKTIFVPDWYYNFPYGIKRKSDVVIIIPTYRPTQSLYNFIAKLLLIRIFDEQNSIKIMVVNDCTPKNDKSQTVIKKLRNLSKNCKDLRLINTPKNLKKSGALNFGIDYILKNKWKCSVVLTCDDDISINKNTISNLISFLLTNPKFGAVCGMCEVRNKRKNILTRLQGLEYHNYNLTKIADNGFINGPLVMPGMLTAFRFKSLRQVGGYSNSNLIEDYEITAHLKEKGWLVGICQNAIASTEVPESLFSLWKQRVRWSYWGLHVVTQYIKHPFTIMQDLVGHLIFVVLTLTILLSFNISDHKANELVVKTLITLAIGQFLFGFIFSLLTLKNYKNADFLDYFIKLTLVPELVYSIILSIVTYGSYIFYIFTKISNTLFPEKLSRVYSIGFRSFNHIGYSVNWNTK